MDHFATLKRRATDLFQSVPQSLPNMPNIPKVNLLSMPAMASPIKGSKPSTGDTMKGTWEHIQLPPIPRSSHTINVVAGTAYIFGGEVRPRQPVSNDMHAIVLPFSGAGADCYNIKAVAAPVPVEHEPQEEGVGVVDNDDDDFDTTYGGAREITKAKEKQKERDLTDIPLSSPPAAGVSPAASAAAATTTKESEERKADAATSEEDDTTTVVTPSSSSSPTATATGKTVLDKGKGRALPAPPPETMPPPRVGHASAVIGSRILIFGGRGGPDLKTPLDERGRVWAFDTKTHTWTALDPVPPTLPAPLTLTLSSVARPTCPSPRSYHAAAATDKPGDPSSGGSGGSSRRRQARPSNWREWAEGDSAEVGTPQAPIVGNVAARATDEDGEGYGTFFVHGGCLADGSRGSDLWAFDVRTRVWQQLPDAPSPGRGGTSLAVSKSRLYRFGGFNGASQEGGRLDYLELGVDTFDDTSALGDEVTVSARGGWKSHFEQPSLSVEGGEDDDDGDNGGGAAGARAGASPLVERSPAWPGARSVAGLQAVTTGGGREYLLLFLGEREPSGAGHEAAGAFWDDVWAFQVPPLGMTPASVTDALKSVFRRKTGEGRWYRVEMGPRVEDDLDSARGPGRRGWIASSTMPELEDNAIVVWGGLDEGNRRLGDGWILRLE